jgi:hypothetical protein
MFKARRMRVTGHVERMWNKRNAYRVLVGKPEGNWPLGRYRHKWDDNKMDFKRKRINLIQDRD